MNGLWRNGLNVQLRVEEVLCVVKANNKTPALKIGFAGTQFSKPLCQESTVSPVAADLEGPNVVAEEMCQDMSKPDKMVRTCNDDPCPYKWWVGPWQTCPSTCYDGVSISYFLLNTIPIKYGS